MIYEKEIPEYALQPAREAEPTQPTQPEGAKGYSKVPEVEAIREPEPTPEPMPESTPEPTPEPTLESEVREEFDELGEQETQQETTASGGPRSGLAWLPAAAAFSGEEVITPPKGDITPAKGDITPANAFFSPLKITAARSEKVESVTIEEDILVPDIKPDMKEILMMDGSVRLISREIAAEESRDETVTISGDISLQVVYIPDGTVDIGGLDAIATRLPFKTDWKLKAMASSLVVFDARISKADYLIINERKFRVKLTLELTAKEYEDCHVNVFEGLVDDEIEVLKEQAEITDLALRKKDMVSIDETLYPKDNAFIPEVILKQDLTIIENYKQITGEKVVINGFIYVNLLYVGTLASGDMASGGTQAETAEAGEMIGKNLPELCQYQGRVEFTEFLPINQSGPWNGSKVSFAEKGIAVRIDVDEEDGRVGFRVKGDVETTVELYKNINREIVVDGYHREKDFCCRFESRGCNTLVGNGMTETSVREIINIPTHVMGVEKVPYCCCSIKNEEARIEQGKGIVEGVLEGKMLCQGEEGSGEIFTLTEEIPFRCAIDIPPARGGEKAWSHTYIKDMWADKINNKQIEFNCTVFATAEVMKETSLRLMEEPGSRQQACGGLRHAMVVSIVQPSDTLWSIAKKYKATVGDIKELNDIEENPQAGRKILIVR